MFEFLFKYPIPVFTRGRFVLLGAWPGWALLMLALVCAGGLAWLIWMRLPQAAPRKTSRRLSPPAPNQEDEFICGIRRQVGGRYWAGKVLPDSGQRSSGHRFYHPRGGVTMSVP